MVVVDKLLKWFEYPINAMLWLAIIAAVAMMLHVSVDVTARFFNHPFAGTTEVVAGWYMIAIAFLPWVWIARNDSHIVAGMFQHIGGPRFEYWLEIAVKIVTVLFLYIFTWQTYRRAVQQTFAGPQGEVWQVGGSFIPIWPARWLLPAAGLLMGVYLVLRIIRDLGGGYQPPSTPASAAGAEL